MPLSSLPLSQRCRFPFLTAEDSPAPPPVLTHLAGMESLLPYGEYERDDSVKRVFNALAKDLVIDSRWLRQLRQYVYDFATRDAESIEYWGSGLLGTHRVVFKTSDSKEWFSAVIDVDDVVLRDETAQCKHINPDFKVSSSPFNLSVVYLMHRVQISSLTPAQKHDALVALVMMFHYRAMTSIMGHYFRYLASKKVAEAAFQALTLRFDIRRLGSWNALFLDRAESIIDPRKGIHYQTFTRMDDDKKVVYMLNDIESRLKSVVNDFSRVFYQVKDRGVVNATDSGFVLLDGKLVVKDVQSGFDKRRHFLEATLQSEGSFYKEELVQYAIKGMNRTPPDRFKALVRELPYYYQSKKGQDAHQFVEHTLTHMFSYLSQNNIKQTDIRQVVVRLRGAYTSNKSTNPLLYTLRDTGDDIVTKLTGVKTRSTVTAMRTSLMLYLVLRAITMDSFK